MDQRVAKMSELINAIRLVKMFAWEKPFLEKILGLRKVEIKELKKSSIWTLTTSTLYPAIPIIAFYFVLLTMTLAGVELDTTKAFTLLFIFNGLYFTMAVLPYSIKFTSEAQVSIQKFQKFLGMLCGVD